MTVCIAAIYRSKEDGPSIIAASDRRISLFGGWLSDQHRSKFRSIHSEWEAMFAGGVEEAKIMLDAITPAMAKLKENTLESVVNCCRKAYAKQRIRLIETQTLPDFDIASYREYRALRHTDERLYVEIAEAIKIAEECWHLLFAGFDKNLVPHIFVISGSGKVEYCDYISRAAIGSGAFSALFWMSYADYTSKRDIGQAILVTAWAKFFAERASDVGEETILTVMKPKRNYALAVDDEELKKAREAWNKLPNIDIESAERIGKKINSMFTFYQKIKSLEPTQSTSQKSEQAQ